MPTTFGGEPIRKTYFILY
ncbi:hypothetical protein [Staphylococcus aureus]